jgi:spore coat polysaccharide biosynthesis protein SpsF
MASALIQARMGSTRLPGKVMLPLDNHYVLNHVVNRVNQAGHIGTTIVATSHERQDDIITQSAPKFGAELYRGSESDVLNRMFEAAKEHDTEIVVRITADCPLLDPSVVDAVVETLQQTSADYASNIQQRTFPRGLDVEAFTFESFERVHEEATEPHHREHVTPYYREHPGTFDLETVTSEMVYDDPQFQNRTDLRLTLDEAADYELLQCLYTEIPYDGILPTKRAIEYIDERNLKHINTDIEQKEVDDASSDSS